MKVVTPFRPFVPESPAHRKLGPFDWVAAVWMLRRSVALACRCDTYALTDLGTPDLGLSHRYAPTETRLMLWILEVCEQYLTSDDFDQDTVLISPDALVFADLHRFFAGADLGIVVRGGKFADKRPLLNGVQFWAVAAKDRLVEFYQRARAIAATLPESSLRWGADTIPLVKLLAPVCAGRQRRAGLTVDGIRHASILLGPTEGDMQRIGRGQRPAPAPIVDFKYTRKWLMPAYYAGTVGKMVTR